MEGIGCKVKILGFILKTLGIKQGCGSLRKDDTLALSIKRLSLFLYPNLTIASGHSQVTSFGEWDSRKVMQVGV